MKTLDEITGTIVDEAYKLYYGLGPGLLESVYEALLARALVRRGLRVERQVTLVFEYDGEVFEEGLRIDLLVEGMVIVELKSVEVIAPVHGKQVLTYLRLAKLQVGLLINFGADSFKHAVKRIVNELPAFASPALRINRPSDDIL